jgi:DNA polymerase-3 subunit delta
VWPLDGQDLLRWLQQRLQKRGLQTDIDGVKILASRIEGNLLAAAQEIEKLYVLYGSGTVSAQQIAEVVADSSRYDVFKLMDSVLAAKVKRAVKILAGLKVEGTAPPVIVWALLREARTLAKIKHALAQGHSLDMALKSQQVWDKRRQLMTDAVRRLSEHDLNTILIVSAKADRQSKGQQSGDVWETLMSLCLLFAAVHVLPITR